MRQKGCGGSMLEFVILITVFVSSFMILYAILGIVHSKKNAVQGRLEKIAKDNPAERDNELNQPLLARVVRPALDSISETVLKITPKELIAKMEKRVVMAGSPYNLGIKDWINVQVVIVILIPAATIAIGYYKSFELKNMIFTVFLEMGFGLVLPNFFLSKKAKERQKKITQSLPDVLDILTVSVEAGLGFDSALAKVIDKMPGPLAAEFDNVLQEMKVGKQKRDALKGMADRLGVQDLTTFIGSVVQADQLGVSIGNVLRIQSEQMRQKRRQRAQEKAMKAPVKMLIPMVLFIFPTIFAVLLGPVALKMLDTFFK
jgi:tight adherence protein C